MENSAAARKVQKADREKLRRDRLNEQFAQLGSALDPDRPKNDKGTILTDAIQLLKDLTAQVDKLKADYNELTEESRELTQEKNDLREEKASLKSDIENLSLQYQQRMRASFPWGAMDHSVVMAPPPYPYPVPVPVPPGAMPIHPSMQPYPFFGNQNPGAVPNSFSAFMPHMATNAPTDQQHSGQCAAPVVQPAAKSHVSNRQDGKHKSPKDVRDERSEDSNDVATELELKTPGSKSDQGSVSMPRKSKKQSRKESSIPGESCSSRCSSRQDSSTNSVACGAKPDS
uniref:BHLH domain-containing protein n=1 Tax=Kalanchoe fedtschenkoi TaxID=63787 RepID=A0A7N0T8F1_KALFE